MASDSLLVDARPKLDKSLALPGTTPVELEGKPLLQTWGRSYKLTFTSKNYGIYWNFNADLGMGYKALFFWTVANQQNLLAMNPFAFLEMATHNDVQIYLPGMYFMVFLHAWPIRFTFADLQATWSMDQMGQYCRSFGYDQNVFDAKVRVKGKYNECYLGLLNWRGRATNTDWKYCTWRTYYPRLPIWKRTYKPEWDSKTDIISW